MRHITVYTTNKEYNHFVELTKSLSYVKKIETDEEPSKKEVVNNIKKGFEEMALIKKGKVKTTSLIDFIGILNETEYQKIKQHTEDARNEWNRDI